MKATDILMSEHRVIERVISALEKGADRVEVGGEMTPQFFLAAADFIKGFADGCHHRKEEGVLFEAMANHGVPVEGGPIGVMLTDHEAGRAFTRGMREAAVKWEAGDEHSKIALAQNVRGYAALLRQHILKEDQVLFPMADRVIPQPAHISVLEGFEQVEHEETGEGVHEKYLALADWLESQVK